MTGTWLDQRPILVAIAGPNGAGKTTFYHAHIVPSGLPLVNADVLAGELELDPYEAAGVADSVRRRFVSQRESFAFETVLSDPVGDKIGFLKAVGESGYTVVVCFIGLSSWRLSRERIAMRVSQGGHDVPNDKLRNRFPRTLANLKRALYELPHVLVYDNSDLAKPYERIATFEKGAATERAQPLPRWFRKLLIQRRST
jgi:predicted ABC-type ATPase